MSSIKIGQRVSKTEGNLFGWTYVNDIPHDTPCVLYIGGDGTTNGKAANGYAKGIQNEILEPMNLDIPVYSVEYNFDGHNKNYARRLDFLKHRTALLDSERELEIPKKVTGEDINPPYVEELFEKAILPRISLSNGKDRLSKEEACRRIRMLNIVAHCHGGYVALQLENKMYKKMKELGYTPAECKNIQSQMLIVAHAPACAIGVSKSQFISFRSTYDMEVPLGQSAVEVLINQAQVKERKRFAAEENKDEKEIAENSWFDFKPCYFENKKQFLVKQKYEWTKEEGPFLINSDEHNNVSYCDGTQTQDGKMMQYFSRTILQNGIKNSLQNSQTFVPLPSIDELILSEDNQHNDKVARVFDKMCENGRKFRKYVAQELVKSRDAITAKNIAVRTKLAAMTKE